jgi:hypothetical protein
VLNAPPLTELTLHPYITVPLPTADSVKVALVPELKKSQSTRFTPPLLENSSAQVDEPVFVLFEYTLYNETHRVVFRYNNRPFLLPVILIPLIRVNDPGVMAPAEQSIAGTFVLDRNPYASCDDAHVAPTMSPNPLFAVLSELYPRMRISAVIVPVVSVLAAPVASDVSVYLSHTVFPATITL